MAGKQAKSLKMRTKQPTNEKTSPWSNKPMVKQATTAKTRPPGPKPSALPYLLDFDYVNSIRRPVAPTTNRATLAAQQAIAGPNNLRPAQL